MSNDSFSHNFESVSQRDWVVQKQLNLILESAIVVREDTVDVSNPRTRFDTEELRSIHIR